MTGQSLTRFDGCEAVLECAYTGAETTLPAAWVVLVTARQPDDAFYREILEVSGPDGPSFRLTRIGDCEAPAIIAAAVHSGHRFAWGTRGCRGVSRLCALVLAVGMPLATGLLALPAVAEDCSSCTARHKSLQALQALRTKEKLPHTPDEAAPEQTSRNPGLDQAAGSDPCRLDVADPDCATSTVLVWMPRLTD